jgi:hypothetical protein
MERHASHAIMPSFRTSRSDDPESAPEPLQIPGSARDGHGMMVMDSSPLSNGIAWRAKLVE